MYMPPFWMMHQHFNTSSEPARYLACAVGSARYPFIALRRRSTDGGGGTSIQQGGRQIEYEDQDPRIHRKFLEELAKPALHRKWTTSSTSRRFARSAEDLTGVIKMPRSIGPAV